MIMSGIMTITVTKASFMII